MSDYTSAAVTSENIVAMTVRELREFLDGLGFWLNYLHRDDATLVRVDFARILKSGEGSPEYRFSFQDGGYHWMRDAASAVPADQGGPVENIGSGMDQPAGESAGTVLGACAERFRTIFEHAATAMGITDLGGRLEQCNPAYCSLLGYTEREFRQMLSASVIHPDDLEDNLTGISRLIAGEIRLFEIRNRYVHKDGHPILVHKLVLLLLDDAGEPGHLVALVTNITARDAAESALRQSEAQLHALTARLQAVREEERTHLAREVHDELGQMLTGLTMDMAWLQKRLPKVIDADLRHEMAAKLVEMSQLTDAMIQSVQKISSELRPAELDNLGLACAIRSEVTRFQQRSGIACEVDVGDEMPAVDANCATGLFRILQEALTNIARHAQATQAKIGLVVTAETVTVTVCDNGQGMALEQMCGKSLGLLGMRERAEQLGGRIVFASEPGNGMRVTVNVPA